MTNRKTVVIFDDERQLREQWAKDLAGVEEFDARFEVKWLIDEDLEAILEKLRERRRQAAGLGGDGFAPDDSELGTADILDAADLLIVDYDLLSLSETGEEVAYLARCFSNCGLIIGVNQFAREGYTFDLTLQGHPASYADLNILAEQLPDPGLWGERWKRIRPWYWPLIPDSIDRFARRSKELELSLDERILEYMGFKDEILELVSPEMLSFIGSKDVTFREFAVQRGLKGRHLKNLPDKALARIAAARLAKWLERVVLPAQNILVDAAHLLERYPSLFKGGTADELVSWPRMHELLAPDPSCLDLEKLSGQRFERYCWLGRPAWFWPRVSANNAIEEVRDPWAARRPLAFCEDASIFVERGEDSPVEFIARVEAPFVRRFVLENNARYGPQLLFAE